MGRIEELAEEYAKHISTPWPRTLAGAQRVIMVTYDKELERVLRARRVLFEMATREAGYDWQEIDLTDAFSAWITSDEYKEEYFDSPEALQLKLNAEFPQHVAARISRALCGSNVTDHSVVAIFGIGSLFGFTRFSSVLRLVENDVRGRLVVFFPGQFENNNYRLLDARDGWNYLAVPITAHGAGGSR